MTVGNVSDLKGLVILRLFPLQPLALPCHATGSHSAWLCEEGRMIFAREAEAQFLAGARAEVRSRLLFTFSLSSKPPGTSKETHRCSMAMS